MTTILTEIFSHDTVKIVHYLISVSFLFFAVLLVVRSVRGISKRVPYKAFDKFLAVAFIVALYLQLILGLFLFTNLGTGLDFHYMPNEGSDMVSKRLWPVEHIVLMLFALFIANLGLIFSFQTRESQSRFKKILIYYTIAIALIAFSLISVYA
ncbi:hypothetical protein OU798_05615 [Prolixibacteraceae bacterium Z1-6]|uniref:Uncharacterized protein n=1 Tax=Draconibacterium aestuarii TaxID=2998507 RepID=A0A9X3F3C8_9BACT|nr:hypothetical protein [Prolixibacteraceae bacterium Z1-6]